MILHSEKGVALIMVLGLLAVLVPAALELNRRVRLGLAGAAETRDALVVREMAAAGVQAAMAVLIRDREISDQDTLRDIWADPARLADVLSGMPFPEGAVTVRITDEAGKIQVPALVRPPRGQSFDPAQRALWLRFLTPFLEDPDGAAARAADPIDIVNALKDWMDSGDAEAVSGLNGAESRFYRALDPPYVCPNRPPASVAELRRVRGVTEDLFFGRGPRPGIASFLSVYDTPAEGDGPTAGPPGRININTAPREVLAALLPESEAALAEVFVDFRDNLAPATLLDDPAWYRKAPGLSHLSWPADLVRTASDCFRITAEARLGARREALVAVVHRVRDANGGWACRPAAWWAEAPSDPLPENLREVR